MTHLMKTSTPAAVRVATWLLTAAKPKSPPSAAFYVFLSSSSSVGVFSFRFRNNCKDDKFVFELYDSPALSSKGRWIDWKFAFGLIIN
jgi:hypothetical protein